MKALWSLLILISLANASESRSYKVSGKVLDFAKVKDLYVHGDECKEKCLAAIRPTQIQTMPKQRGELLSSKASLICQKTKGKSVFGVDEKKNMMALCLYEDGSMVDYKSLEGLKIK